MRKLVGRRAGLALCLVFMASGCAADWEWRSGSWDRCSRWEPGHGGVLISGDGETGAIVLGAALAVFAIAELVRRCCEP